MTEKKKVTKGKEQKERDKNKKKGTKIDGEKR